MPIFVNLQPCLTLGNLNFFLHTRCICVLCMIRTIYSTLCVFCEVKTSITLILKILNFSLNSDQDIQDETISVTKRKKEDTITTAAYKFVLISPKPDQEGNTLMFLSELREFPSAPCLAGKEKKKTWWRLESPCCWNRARPWHASELVSFLVGLWTYQHPGTFNAYET